MQTSTVLEKNVEVKVARKKQPIEQLIKNSVTNYATRNYRNTLVGVTQRMRTATAIEPKKSMWKCEVIVTDHALLRWNERVGGDYFTTTKELAKVLTSIFSTSVMRYEVLEEPSKDFDTYLIELDRDIICSVLIEGNKVVFCSFFGRVSLQPSLANWGRLRSYLQAKSKSKDKVKLALEPSVLKQQQLPAMPIEHTVLRLHNRQLTLEKYFVKEQNEPVYVLFSQQTDKRGNVNFNPLNRMLINTKECLYNPKNEIPMVILNTLTVEGQEEFVQKYLAQRNEFKKKQVLVH